MSRHSGRTITVLGDEVGYRYFIFNDTPDVIAQHPIALWDEYFIT